MGLTTTESIMLENKEQNKEQWAKELTGQKTQMAALDSVLRILKRQNELRKLNDAIAVKEENFILLRPTWKFETDPEYLKNHLEVTKLTQEVRDIEFKNTITQRETDYQRVATQYNQLKTDYDRLCNEIEELKKKGDTDGE